jgi:hypothetical protein
MSVMLGNLTVEQMEKRAGVQFSDELKTLMRDTHQQEASNIARGKWHCFDIPFHLVCGDMELAQKIYDHLKSNSDKFSEPLAISIT